MHKDKCRPKYLRKNISFYNNKDKSKYKVHYI